MPKYRLLTMEELQSLEKEFVEFLVLNGIVADDWEKIKKEDPDKALKITDLFSDAVFEQVLRNVKYLQKTTKKELFVFECLKDKIKLIGLSAVSIEEADLTNADYVEKAIEQPPKGFNIFNTEKEYAKVREIEIFEMLKSGALVSDEKLYTVLQRSLEKSN